MVVDMYIIGPKKDRFKPVFFGLFDFFKMKRPIKTAKDQQMVFFSLGLVWS